MYKNALNASVAYNAIIAAIEPTQIAEISFRGHLVDSAAPFLEKKNLTVSYKIEDDRI